MQLVTGTFKVLLHLRLKKNRSSSTQQPRLRQPCFIQGLQNADPDMAWFKVQTFLPTWLLTVLINRSLTRKNIWHEIIRLTEIFAKFNYLKLLFRRTNKFCNQLEVIKICYYVSKTKLTKTYGTYLQCHFFGG